MKQWETSLPIMTKMTQDVTPPLPMQNRICISATQICIYSVLVSLFSCVFNHEKYFMARSASLNSCKVLYQYSLLCTPYHRYKINDDLFCSSHSQETRAYESKSALHSAPLDGVGICHCKPEGEALRRFTRVHHTSKLELFQN